MQIPVNLVGGAPPLRIDFAGKRFVLLDTGAASSVSVRLMRGTLELEAVSTAKRGLRADVPDGFTSLELSSTVDALLQVIVSEGLVDISFLDGMQVNATLAGTYDGSVAHPINVSGVTVNDAPSTANNSLGPTACNGAGTTLVKAANANSRRCRFTNLGPDPVTLGPVGHTWAKRAIVLEGPAVGATAGETWIEDNAANLAWYGITDAGKAASVTVQEIVN